MPLDTRIALGVQPLKLENPMNQLAQFLQVQGAQRQNQLGEMQMRESERAMRDADAERANVNALNALYPKFMRPDGSLDEAGLLRGVADLGQGSRIPAMQEQFTKRAAAEADLRAKKTKADADQFGLTRDQYKAGAQSLAALTSAEEAAQSLEQQIAAGMVRPEVAGILRAALPKTSDPAEFQQWKLRMSASIADPSKMVELLTPLIQTNNTGGATVTQAIDKMTGVGRETGRIANTATPGELISSADRAKALEQQAREAAAGRSLRREEMNMVDRRAREANAARTTEAASNVPSATPVLGVPVPTVTPWANQTRPIDANRVKAQEMARGAKEIEKDADEAAKAAAAARQAERFMALNAKRDTGGLLDKLPPGRFIQGFDSDFASMQEITADLAPNMRPPGSGATSDFDAKQYERATVGVEKPKETNDNIARAIVARARQSSDYAEFRATYLEQNGTLSGSDRYWKQYVEKNPIFDKSKPDQFALNPKRQQWRDFFQSSTGQPAPAPASSPSPAPGPAPARPAGGTVLRFDAQGNRIP